MQDIDHAKQIADMLATIERHGMHDLRILQVMARIPRHRFIPEAAPPHINPYADCPCPIGHGQTISQPFIVAYMTEKLRIKPGERVLEIGTGSGYQAAVLAALGAELYSIELVPALADHARKTLAAMGYTNVHIRNGSGYDGWREESPFDAVIVTCAPETVPQQLVDQLADNGRMILPVGIGIQRLIRIERRGASIVQEPDIAVRFVPMVQAPQLATP